MSDPFTYDFFVSRRGTVATTAQEVADVLAGEGHKVVVQDYDFAASDHFVLDIDKGLKQARHLLILYSGDYDSEFWTRQEFANFLAARAGDDQRRIGLLRCDDSVPAGLLAGITHGVLTGVADPAERRRVILAVAEGRTPAARPSPRVFGGAMPLANRLFTGRDDLLTAMHGALAAEDAAAALTQTTVHGLGGVGKTSLAREYIERHAEDYPGGVWWITAADRAGTMEGLAALARALDPRVPEDIPAEEAAKAGLAELGRRHAPFLLVYDNAPDPTSLVGLLPTRGAKVLITSRHPGWNRQAVPLRVDAMAEDDAVALLQAAADRSDEAGARRLARELGCLPLALDQAGAYARETQTGFDDYAAQVGELLNRAGGNPDYPESVAATFDLAITKAAERAPTAEAVLALFAWYAPERIPLSLFDAPPAERDAAMAALGNLSLLASAEETVAGPTVTLHRLVQAVMRNRLATRERSDEAREDATKRIDAVFPRGTFSEPTLWPLCRALLPHVRALEARTTPTRESAAFANILCEADVFLEGSGDIARAVIYSRRALEIRERRLGREHPETLRSRSNLASCLELLGDAAGALKLFLQVLKRRRREFGPDDAITHFSMNNVANCLRQLGDGTGAVKICRKAFESSKRVHGMEHLGTLLSLNNLAKCLISVGDLIEALPLARKAFDCCEMVVGTEHPYTLASLNNLASCLKMIGDAASALPLFRRALESSERVLGTEHPRTLANVNDLADCVLTLGNTAEALPLFRRALENRERKLGAAHPDTLISVNNLAGCLRALGDVTVALPLYRRAADGMERLYGPDHPSTRTLKANLEIAARAAGMSKGATPNRS